MAVTITKYQRPGSRITTVHLQALAATPVLLLPGAGALLSIAPVNVDNNADVWIKLYNQLDTPVPGTDYPVMKLKAQRLNGADRVCPRYRPRGLGDSDEQNMWTFTGGLWIIASADKGLGSTAPDVSNPTYCICELYSEEEA